MILEIVGSRIYAPYLGASIYVWTSLIGMIMGSLSVGYYYGGKLADKSADYKTLSVIIFLAGCFIFLTNIIKNLVLFSAITLYPDPKSASIFAGFFLFVIPGILLGMVSPYAVKLRLISLSNSASTVGNLYAISTVGSIFGTFIAGFYLISLFGTTTVVYILSVIMIVLSVFAYPKDRISLKIPLLFICVILSINRKDIFMVDIKNMVDVDTRYNRVWIFDGVDKESNRPVKSMILNKQNASAIFIDGSSGLVYEYNKYFNLAGFFKPNLGSALLVGGAAYTYPREFLKKFPQATLDVVEIDPELAVLAKKYFGLQDNDRMSIYPEDGRVFLNNTEKKYDAVLLDVFNSYVSMPFQLTTVEAVQKIYNMLNNNGVVVTNIVSSIEGRSSRFYVEEFNTYKNVFPHVYVFKVKSDANNIMQNLILVGVKRNDGLVLESQDLEDNSMLKNRIVGPELDERKILTDDYAPVESFFSPVL